jgi:hypothetical protein
MMIIVYHFSFRPPPAVLLRGLPAVAAPAECLPVRPVPEQYHVPFVRNDVIGDCRPAQEAAPLTFGAKRILMKELPRRLAPLASISPCRGARAVAVVLPPFSPLMLAAAPFMGERPAAGMRARVRRRIGHQEYFLLRTISLTSAEVLPSSGAFLPGNIVWSDSAALRWQSLHVQRTQDGPLRSSPSRRPSPSPMQSNSGRIN